MTLTGVPEAVEFDGSAMSMRFGTLAISVPQGDSPWTPGTCVQLQAALGADGWVAHAMTLLALPNAKEQAHSPQAAGAAVGVGRNITPIRAESKAAVDPSRTLRTAAPPASPFAALSQARHARPAAAPAKTASTRPAFDPAAPHDEDVPF